jgi:hypothetical protein
MMPVILDPGFVATEPMPEATGTKLKERQRYYRGESSGKTYFRDSSGQLFEIVALRIEWPEAITCDGRKQMALGDPYGEASKTAAARNRRYRQRRASGRASAKLGPKDFATAEAQAIA